MRPTVPPNIPEKTGLKVGCEGVLTKLLMLQISHFSIVITGQKRGNVSLAHIIEHAADNDFRFQLYRTFTMPAISFLLIKVSTRDFYQFLKNSVCLITVKPKSWGRLKHHVG